MSNFFNGYNPYQQFPNAPPNNIFMDMFMKQFNEFARNIQGNPQQIVQNLLDTGKMSQTQFNQFRNIANSLTGRRL